MQSKCIMQRCKTPILCNGSVFKFPTQFLRRNSRGNLSLHLNYHISWVLFCTISEHHLKEGFYIRLDHQINSLMTDFATSIRRKFTEQILYFGTVLFFLCEHLLF